MAADLSLSKIVKQKSISVTEATQRIADLGWAPDYFEEILKYPTDYKVEKAPKDPMKQVLRSYFPMQEEKDNRVYGALDAALRGDMFRNVEPRWRSCSWRLFRFRKFPLPGRWLFRARLRPAKTCAPASQCR